MKNQSVSAEIIKIYIQETRKVILKLKKNPGNFSEILLDMRMSKDNSRLFGFDPLFRLFKSLEDVFFALKKNDISFTDNLKNLIILTADKILECCKLLEKNQFALNPSVLKNVDVKLYLIYFDKALSGEIFDSSNLGRKENNYNSEKKENQIKADKVIQINSSTLEDVINMQEEMISYSSVIGNQIELLKKAIKENDINSLKDIYKLLSDDSQNLQNNLFILHDHFCSLMKNEDFLKKHEKLTGFFIYSNSEKYFISSEGILDVISVNPENYILKQNQKFIIYENEEE